jgi:acyl transferase domain-containing protein
MTIPETAVPNDSSIAIIGMAGRFPGAPDSIDEYWTNLVNGVESIRRLTDRELTAAGVDADTTARASYVKAAAILDGIDLFDADFFGFTPREAEILDPQQRLFLECAWQALENAGYNPDEDNGAIGAFAGSSMNTYVFNIYSNRAIRTEITGLQALIGNDTNHLATRAGYKLNLRGPCVTVQTACSTSLVAVHVAAQALLTGECDVALAGGVAVRVPQAGYVYDEGGIFSPDGECRAFDASGRGTVPGCGVGVVVLKRLADALADGDCIDAVIRGSAINNDGATKLGFTAPSIEGQSQAIEQALAVAGVHPETISYVETHGTGTTLGDPVEIAALTKAYRVHTDRKGFCAIGSVKTNIGHNFAASGVAGLIKTVLALKHGTIPPSLHYSEPNPEANLPDSPFYVNTTAANWVSDEGPRRAGVSSFGFGGTNAHLVLEEAPQVSESMPSRPWQLLVLSAKTPTALAQRTRDLLAELRHHPDHNLGDVAHTLQIGRKVFSHRRTLVCRDVQEACRLLESLDPARVRTSQEEPRYRPIVFVFPATISCTRPHVRELYENEAIFQAEVERCFSLLGSVTHVQVRDSMLDAHGADAPANPLATFVFEYALAKLWMAWGIRPQVLSGDGVGERVVSVVAGVFPLESVLAHLAGHGPLLDPPGAPNIPVVSIGNREFTDVLNDPAHVLLEIGGAAGPTRVGGAEIAGTGRVIASMAADRDEQPAAALLLDALGQLWLAGARIEWAAFYATEPRVRLHLPGYPFERQRFWIESGDRFSAFEHEQTAGSDTAAPERHARPAVSTHYVEPRHPLEETIAHMWEELLGLDRVGIDDNFVELGGHSLLAVHLISRVRDELHVNVPAEALYRKPTVAGMTEIVLQKLTEGADEALLAETLQDAERAAL